MNLRRILAALALIVLVAESSSAAEQSDGYISFVGRVVSSTISLQSDAETLVTHFNARFLIAMVVTESSNPSIQVGDTKKIAIHSPAMTFGAQSAIGREFRVIISGRKPDRPNRFSTIIAKPR